MYYRIPESLVATSVPEIVAYGLTTAGTSSPWREALCLFYRMIVVHENSAAKRIDNFMDEVGDFRESLEPLMPDRT